MGSTLGMETAWDSLSLPLTSYARSLSLSHKQTNKHILAILKLEIHMYYVVLRWRRSLLTVPHIPKTTSKEHMLYKVPISNTNLYLAPPISELLWPLTQ